MRRFHLCLCLILITGCAGPKYLGVSPQQTVVDGWVIDVYHKGEKAQTIRRTSTMLPKVTDMAIRSTVAIEGITGCKVVPGSLIGDAALMNAKLRCPSG